MSNFIGISDGSISTEERHDIMGPAGRPLDGDAGGGTAAAVVALACARRTAVVWRDIMGPSLIPIKPLTSTCWAY